MSVTTHGVEGKIVQYSEFLAHAIIRRCEKEKERERERERERAEMERSGIKERRGGETSRYSCLRE